MGTRVGIRLGTVTGTRVGTGMGTINGNWIGNKIEISSLQLGEAF